MSSKGISYKSNSASYSSSSYGSGYGSSSKEVDSFKDGYKEGENAKESKWKNDKKDGQNLEAASENEGSKSKKQVPHRARYRKDIFVVFVSSPFKLEICFFLCLRQIRLIIALVSKYLGIFRLTSFFYLNEKNCVGVAVL